MVGDKFIVIGDSSEFIPIEDIYAFTYDCGNGRTVLRLKIKSDVKTFDELKVIFDEDTSIKAYEVREEQALTLSDGYTSAEAKVQTDIFEHFSKDFQCEYISSEAAYCIEVTKKSDEEIDTDTTANDTMDAYAAIAEVYEMN